LNACQVMDRGRHLVVADIGTSEPDTEVDWSRLQ
jgi:hypothetical protein